MQYDFDQIINRCQTGSLKWDFNKEIFSREDILPLWVADMDFASPEPVRKALLNRAEHGIYGYTQFLDGYFESIITWMHKRHEWDIQRDWIVFSPGVVTALSGLVQSLTQPGDKILIQSPVYPPFAQVIRNHGRELVNSQLRLENDEYIMDYEDIEAKCNRGVKMMLLCSPHNPVGRVWKREELERLTNICLEHDVLIVSDEIHSDLIFEKNTHIPLPTISPNLVERSIVCTAPSKTFNLAGLQTSSLLIPNPELRRTFQSFLKNNGMDHPSVFGIVAQEAAYRHGDEWLDQLLVYLKGNIDILLQFIHSELPHVKVIPPQGTYLAWLDFRYLGLQPKELQDFLVHQAGVGLNAGYTFGPGGEGFARLNFACPRSILEEGLKRISKAVQAQF